MELDERFYPSALLVGRSPHWQALLEKLQDACRKGGGENLDIQAFSALLPALGFESPFRLYIEMVRLCVLIGVAELAPVPFSHKDCSSWVTPLLALIARQGENRTGASIRKIPLHRAGQHLYTASIQAEDWNVPGVRLLWKRKVPFLGDEHSILRLASLSQIPKLVRAALPGIVVTPVGDASRDGLDYCLILSIKQADGLWTECLRAGSVALHCAQVGDADQFFLTEESP
jgi:predicted component of type VI protein secretion system